MGKSGGIFLIGQDTSIDEFVIHVQGELQYSKTINKKSDEDDSAKTQETHLYIRNISMAYANIELGKGDASSSLLILTEYENGDPGTVNSPGLLKNFNEHLEKTVKELRSKRPDIQKNYGMVMENSVAPYSKCLGLYDNFSDAKDMYLIFCKRHIPEALRRSGSCVEDFTVKTATERQD